MISRCRQVRECCFTHRAHVGDCHGRNVQLQSVRAAQKQGMHVMRHSCTVGIKKTPCISLLPLSRICTDIFCAFLPFIKLLQNFKCHLQTALPTCQREQSAPPHSTCLDTCPCMRAQKIAAYTCLTTKVILLNLLRRSLCPAHSTNSELHCKWHAFDAALCS